ncbi:MAG: polysaccharide deacetylase family protein [Rhodoblastus sp.]
MKRISGKGQLTVLNFHKISDHPFDRHEAVPPLVFDEIVGWLKQNFDIVSFRDLPHLRPGGRPRLIVTFDDGYLEFIDVAAPIARRHAIPVNINIVPGCVDDGTPPFNVIVKDFIFQAPALLLRETPLPGLPHGADPDRRDVSALIASAALKNRPIAQQRAEWKTLWPKISRFDGLKTTPMMTRSHILQLIDEFECGAHSFEHATMSAETDDYLRDDFERCRKWWRDVIGRECEIYSFPNGGATARQTDLALQHGFSQALLVGENYSAIDARIHPRLTMSGRHFREALVRALGGPRYWKHGV